MISCFLPVDKPVGVTSHDVVALLRAVTGAPKVGHTGTLDPFATGVLALAFGTSTRLISYLDEDHKVYDATVALGTATDTGDPTGQVIRSAPVPALDRASVEAVLAGFLGVQMQAPPRYSAVKVRGKPLYAYARAGEDVVAAPRPTRIDRIDLLDLQESSLRVMITCGRGTYARVLADEIATALGTAGHLAALRRTETGPFHVDRALTLSELAQIAGGRPDWEAVLRPSRGPDRVRWAPRSEVWAALATWMVRPLDVLSHMAMVPIAPGSRAAVLAGSGLPAPPPAIRVGDLYLATDGDEILAVLSRDPHGPRVKSALVEG